MGSFLFETSGSNLLLHLAGASSSIGGGPCEWASLWIRFEG